MGQTFSQFFPPKPAFTEKHVPDLQGKVYIVTGANTGVGKDLAAILYAKNATVYIAARSQDKSLAAIDDIKKGAPKSSGRLAFLRLDLSDLTKIKASAEEFLTKESRLDVLVNNAGVLEATDSKVKRTAQGYETCLGVNNVGTFMFTKLLTPTLVATAKVEQPGSVRVLWVSSAAAEALGHNPGGVDLTNLDYHIPKPGMYRYGVSKAGNYLHAAEFAKRYKADGVVSLPLHPGNLDSDLYRAQGAAFHFILRHTILYPTIYGAYTELFAALSPQMTLAKTGSWTVVPWGRVNPIRKDLLAATKTKAEGGSGIAEKFWEWTEDQVRPYL
ncbi:NAD(P)-binding protein [Thozetella sp. PMI_491]|nr:NAD(P)-binding protein [Thozetella sp. PMI_491]